MPAASVPLFEPPQVENPKIPVPWEREVKAALIDFAQCDFPPPGKNRLWLDHGTE